MTQASDSNIGPKVQHLNNGDSLVIKSGGELVIETGASIKTGAGTATAAPSNFTAGTNLTTPTAGASEFDGKVFYDTAVASSRQVRDTEQFCVLTSDYSATDSAAAQK